MTSVFDEKKGAESKKLSPDDMKTALQMRQDNYSVAAIAKLLTSQLGRTVKEKEIEDALRGTSREVQKRGRKSQEATVTKEDIIDALTESVTALKKKVPEKDIQATKNVAKLLGGKEAIYKLAHERILKKGKYIEYSNLKKALTEKNIDLETIIGQKTEVIAAEKPLIDLESQEAWAECFSDAQWKPKPGQITNTKRYLRHLNDIIALRNATWELPTGIELPLPNSESQFSAFADFLRNSVAHIKNATYKDIPFVKKVNYKPISEWTKDDLYWAFNYFDYVQGRGQLHPRIAVRRLQLFAYGNRWGKIDASGAKYGTPESLQKATISKEVKKYSKYQASKTESLKSVPTSKQIKPMLGFLRNYKYDGKSLLQYSMEKGGTLSEKQKAELERLQVDLATNIFMDTGCRMGWTMETGLKSVEFSNIGAHTMTLMEKKRKKEIAVELDPLIITKINKLKEKMKDYSIKTDECKIINLNASIMNEYYRAAAEAAGLVKYIYKYGIKRKIPLTNKYYIEEFVENDPRRKDPSFRHRAPSVLGHPLTETDTDMDFHAHLFRAFHLRMCAEAGIPFHQAVKEGVPWESIDVAFKYYASGFKIDEDATKKKEKLFSELV